MMTQYWTILSMLFILVKNIQTEESSEEVDMENLPLTKTLGYAIRKNFGNNLEDARLNQEYLYQYQEMMKASQESFESFENQGSSKLRRSKGEGVPDGRHRSVHQSAVGSRRARSQELRRRKLYSQSQRSHQKYSKKSSIESYLD